MITQMLSTTPWLIPLAQEVTGMLMLTTTTIKLVLNGRLFPLRTWRPTTYPRIKSLLLLSVRTMSPTSLRLLMLTDKEPSRLRTPSLLTPSLMYVRDSLSGGSTTVRLDQVSPPRALTRPLPFQMVSQLVLLLMMMPTLMLVQELPLLHENNENAKTFLTCIN